MERVTANNGGEPAVADQLLSESLFLAPTQSTVGNPMGESSSLDTHVASTTTALISEGLAKYNHLRTKRYETVSVLLLYWKDDDLGCAAEVADLGRVFRNDFNYSVGSYKIPSRDPQSSLNLKMAQFISECGGDNNLIIVYYGGHGGLENPEKTSCTWAAVREDGPTLDWSTIQPSLFSAGCDVLVLLDCCFAGQAVRSRASRKIEFLAATDKDQFTAAGKGKYKSFTRVLIRELEQTLRRDGIVTIPTIHSQMVQAGIGLWKQPFYVSLGDGASSAPIKMTKMESPRSKETHLAPKFPGAMLHFKLSLFEPLDSSTAASLIEWMTRDSPTSIQNIQLADQVFHNAQGANRLGARLLSQDSGSEGRVLPCLTAQAQREGLHLFENLKNALSAPSSTRLTDGEAMSMIDHVKQRSNELITFVEDSLESLGPDSLKSLKIDDSLQTEDLRNRIAMRLTLISESSALEKSMVVFSGPSRKDQRLRLGKKSGATVLVEYVTYERSGDAIPVKLLQQIKKISALHLEPKSRPFRCLQGLGFLDESLYGPRFGFIYKAPEESAQLRFSTLSDLIGELKVVHLEIRIHMASVLCNALLHLHSLGWYHKNIRSSNILLFSKPIKNTHEESSSYSAWDLDNPYLIGFNCSRPVEAETANTVDFTPASMIYRHPDRWGRSFRFMKHHDVYALGIMLLEIGCWTLLPRMDSKRDKFQHIGNPEALRRILLEDCVPKVAHAAGSKYAEGVKFCLECRDWTAYEPWEAQKMIRERVLGLLQMD